MNILFKNELVAEAKRLKEPFRKKSFWELRRYLSKWINFYPKPIDGKFDVPDFYKDRKGRDQAVKDLEISSSLMLLLSNIYLIEEKESHAQKIIDLCKVWTNSITDYKTGQAEYEANWNLQKMSVALSTLKELKNKEIKRFFDYDFQQSLKLEKMNERTNNLRIWLGAHMIASALNKEDKKQFARANDIFKLTLQENIAKEGYMPLEVAREERGIHYTFFALDALFFIAEVALNWDVNFYDYTYHGVNLKKAVEYIIPFINTPGKWPWSKVPQDFSVFPKHHSGWCEVAYRRWKLKGLEKFLKENRSIFDSRFGGAQTLFNGISI